MQPKKNESGESQSTDGTQTVDGSTQSTGSQKSQK